MRNFISLRLMILLVSTLSLAGCGVTKLWGDDASTTQNTERSGPTMREQAASLADPVWEPEDKRSLMSQMAGVLVNGARSAGQALDVFDWTGSESPETRQAKTYLTQIKTRVGEGSLLVAVIGDIQEKNQAAADFQAAGSKAKDFYTAELDNIGKEPENSVRKDRTKRLSNDADEDRRAAVQASKAVRQQASVFAATAAVLKASDEKIDVEPLESEVEQLLVKADELRSLADRLKVN